MITVEFVSNLPSGKVVYRGYRKENGTRAWESEYINGLRDGLYKVYDGDEKLLSKDLFSKGYHIKTII